MPKEIYHFVFKYPKRLLWDFLSVFLPTFIMGTIIIVALNMVYKTESWGFVGVIVILGFIVSFMIALIWILIGRSYGEDVSNDEFILYENGWFVFWNAEKGWIAPAKLDWILPPVKSKKELEKKIGYKPNGEYCLHDRYYRLIRKKKNFYKVGFGLVWTYPTKKWENWVFSAGVGGWLDENNHKTLLKLVEFMKEKAKENVESGKIKIPAQNMKQEHVEYYQLSAYWNEVFQKENIRELYRKETGEDLPEPVRSYLFNYEKYKNVYLKNKRETGDWFGRRKS